MTCILSLLVGRSIRCYNCEGRESACDKALLLLNQGKALRVCQGETDRCMRVWRKVNKYEAIVQNSCSNERLCDKLEKACERLNKEGYKCAVACCHDDACNVAEPGKYFSPYLLIVCITIGVIRSLNFT